MSSKRNSIGEFEEIILIITASLAGEAYGVTITRELEKKTGRSAGFNTVHTTLQRLEDKGLIRSEMGGATTERGGRRKRYFAITALGSRTIRELKELRERLWKELPAKVLGISRG
ncbi:MAG TPA: PadR family transcriptional regulator [Cyclobacteriaceae bacterium]|jgi:DNA-binding PadR family transcriptional regulator|nr:PadR family transcriptional regulator [Cyclobacteriaceae bacterium]